MITRLITEFRALSRTCCHRCLNSCSWFLNVQDKHYLLHVKVFFFLHVIRSAEDLKTLQRLQQIIFKSVNGSRSVLNVCGVRPAVCEKIQILRSKTLKPEGTRFILSSKTISVLSCTFSVSLFQADKYVIKKEQK